MVFALFNSLVGENVITVLLNNTQHLLPSLWIAMQRVIKCLFAQLSIFCTSSPAKCQSTLYIFTLRYDLKMDRSENNANAKYEVRLSLKSFHDDFFMASMRRRASLEKPCLCLKSNFIPCHLLSFKCIKILWIGKMLLHQATLITQFPFFPSYATSLSPYTSSQAHILQ